MTPRNKQKQGYPRNIQQKFETNFN